jgi:hypothetical protein
MKLKLICVALLVAACAPLALDGTAAPTPPLAVTATPAPPEVAPTAIRELPTGRAPATVEPARPPEVAAIPPELWESIAADLEVRTSALRADFKVIQAEAVQWNDGSLGCPQPGLEYTQAIVDGYRIVVEWGGQQFDYRTGKGQHFVLCQSPITIDDGTLPPTMVITLPNIQQP